MLLTGPRVASADCEYHNGYYDQALRGTCTAEVEVPAGCPIHVLTPSGELPKLALYRGTQDLMVVPTTTLVDTISVPMDIQEWACDCSRTPGARAFDRSEVSLPGAAEGDHVEIDSGQLIQPQSITIGPAGPCPAVTWPTAISVATQCDPCANPSPYDDDGGGCTAGHGRGWLVGLAFVVGCARRRRSRK